jgi:hypothetical protein
VSAQGLSERRSIADPPTSAPAVSDADMPHQIQESWCGLKSPTLTTPEDSTPLTHLSPAPTHQRGRQSKSCSSTDGVARHHVCRVRCRLGHIHQSTPQPHHRPLRPLWRVPTPIEQGPCQLTHPEPYAGRQRCRSFRFRLRHRLHSHRVLLPNTTRATTMHTPTCAPKTEQQRYALLLFPWCRAETD